MNIKKLSLGALLLIISSCGANEHITKLNSEIQKKDSYVPSLQEDQNYQNNIDNKVLPYCLAFAKEHNTFAVGTFTNSLNKLVTFGKFKGVDNIDISYATYPARPESPALVILPGRTEPFAKYCELIYDLRNSNFSIYIMDFRGQGWSGRMTTDSQLGHVENFNHYVSDIQTFIEQVVNKNKHKKVFALAHSMGGAALTALLEKNNKLFNAVVLSAPMLKINTNPYSNFTAYSITNSLCFLGQDKSYTIGRGAYNNNPDFNNPLDNGVTHSHYRFYANVNLIKKYPELAIGGPSNRWMQQSLNATSEIGERAKRIRTPFLLLQAEKDEIVLAEGQNHVCDKASQYCQKILIKDSAHEILMERDNIRIQALRYIFSFFISK